VSGRRERDRDGGGAGVTGSISIQKTTAVLSLVLGSGSLAITSYLMASLSMDHSNLTQWKVDLEWIFTSTNLTLLFILISIALGSSGTLRRMSLIMGISLSAFSLLAMFLLVSLPRPFLPPIQ
jgi:hypothetical protein